MCTSSRQLTWHGTDANLATSLLEYGLVIRYVPRRRSWQCIYRNDYESGKYCDGWITEQDLKEMFLSGWAKDKLIDFCRYVSMSWLEWLESSVASRISDVISYFNSMDVFGYDYSAGRTLEEVARELRIKKEDLCVNVL